MAIKFSVLRIGEKSDRGPNGECGIVIVSTEVSFSHGETGYCAEAHQHSKTCAVELLDRKPVLVAAKAAVLDVDGVTVLEPAVEQVLGPSIREKCVAWHAEEEPAAADVAPLPTKTVQRVVDGKTKSVQEPDRDLA